MADDAASYGSSLRARLARNLDEFDRIGTTEKKELRHAAVTVTLLPGDSGVPAFVLTRRASRLSSHKGQWALPGGRVEPGETAEQAALRELEEEVGLSLDSSAVLGLLDDYETRSGYNITPELILSAGYYYQSSDQGSADGSGVKGRLAYSINENITIGGSFRLFFAGCATSAPLFVSALDHPCQ